MVQVHSYGSWPQSTLLPISSNIRRIRLTFSVATELNQQMQSNTAVSTVNIPKTRWSCSWTYNINKLLVSPSERLNNIRLQRTIVTYPASKFHGERIQRYLWNREHMERKTKDYMACSHNRRISHHVSVTVPVYCPWRAPAKIKRGGHSGVLTGMWINLAKDIPLCKVTSQN